jgi:hypothetical protein
MLRAISTWSAAAGRPHDNAARSPHQRRSWSQSRSGTPISENIVPVGSGRASAATRSNSSASPTASSSSPAAARMPSASSAIRLEVNARLVGRRSRACAGSSRLTIEGCWPPSARIAAASGCSGASGCWAIADEKVAESRSTRSTSA